MREFSRNDDVRKAIAVHVGDVRVFRRAGLGPFRERDVVPAIWTGRPEGDPDITVRLAVILGIAFVHRHDVIKTVAIQICHGEAVAAGERDGQVRADIDHVLAPRDVAAMARPGRGRLMADAFGCRGDRRAGDMATCTGNGDGKRRCGNPFTNRRHRTLLCGTMAPKRSASGANLARVVRGSERALDANLLRSARWPARVARAGVVGLGLAWLMPAYAEGPVELAKAEPSRRWSARAR